jgi:hypothetical protein
LVTKQVPKEGGGTKSVIESFWFLGSEVTVTEYHDGKLQNPVDSRDPSDPYARERKKVAELKKLLGERTGFGSDK